jgi:hypothetical protein
MIAGTRHRNAPRLVRMLVLVMATAATRKVPAVVEEKPHDVSDFHGRTVGVARSRNQCKNETRSSELVLQCASPSVAA